MVYENQGNRGQTTDNLVISRQDGMDEAEVRFVPVLVCSYWRFRDEKHLWRRITVSPWVRGDSFGGWA